MSAASLGILAPGLSRSRVDASRSCARIRVAEDSERLAQALQNFLREKDRDPSASGNKLGDQIFRGGPNASLLRDAAVSRVGRRAGGVVACALQIRPAQDPMSSLIAPTSSPSDQPKRNALIAQLKARAGIALPQVAYVMKVRFTTMPPRPRRAGRCLYVNGFRIPKYWECKDGV